MDVRGSDYKDTKKKMGKSDLVKSKMLLTELRPFGEPMHK
jgi:hypothetical protein